ncbi:MAG: hypothetical protein AAGC60_19480 [Acidobacteriota bacterium]
MSTTSAAIDSVSAALDAGVRYLSAHRLPTGGAAARLPSADGVLDAVPAVAPTAYLCLALERLVKSRGPSRSRPRLDAMLRATRGWLRRHEEPGGGWRRLGRAAGGVIELETSALAALALAPDRRTRPRAVALAAARPDPASYAGALRRALERFSGFEPCQRPASTVPPTIQAGTPTADPRERPFPRAAAVRWAHALVHDEPTRTPDDTEQAERPKGPLEASFYLLSQADEGSTGTHADAARQVLVDHLLDPLADDLVEACDAPPSGPGLRSPVAVAALAVAALAAVSRDTEDWR